MEHALDTSVAVSEHNRAQRDTFVGCLGFLSLDLDRHVGTEDLAELSGREIGIAVIHHASVVQDDPSGTDLLDQVEAMADEQDRASVVLELRNLVQAFTREVLITDGQDLVDEQHVRIDVHGNREA